MTTQFVLAGGQEIADYNGTRVGTPWVLTVRGAGGLPVAAITPGGGAESVVYYHHDVLGSTVASTTAGTGGAAEVYLYDDYGKPQGGSWLAYQYAGYRYDRETGLYYVQARYYSPVLGRFLQADPAGIKGGNNLYAYVGNDPTDLVDPMGLCASDVPTSQQMSDIFGNSNPNVAPDPTVPWSIVPAGNPEVYTTASPLNNSYTQTQFAGTAYTYQVVNAYGNPITVPMVVSESFSNISLTQGTSLPTQAPVAGSWNLPQAGGGSFTDFVGASVYTGTGQSPLPSSFSSMAGQAVSVTQSFTVATDNAVTTLSTTNTLQVIVDSSGSVTGTATNITP